MKKIKRVTKNKKSDFSRAPGLLRLVLGWFLTYRLVSTAEREPASMSGEQRGERGGPSALLSGLPVRDANAFAQRKLDAASFPACALLLPELTTRGSLGPHPSQTNAGHGGANLPRHARPHEPPSRPRRVPASKGFPPTPADPRPSLPIEKLAPPQLSARRRQTSSCGTSGSSPRCVRACAGRAAPVHLTPGSRPRRSNASGKSGRPPLQRRRGKPPSSPGRQVNDSLTLFSGTF